MKSRPLKRRNRKKKLSTKRRKEPRTWVNSKMSSNMSCLIG